MKPPKLREHQEKNLIRLQNLLEAKIQRSQEQEKPHHNQERRVRAGGAGGDSRFGGLQDPVPLGEDGLLCTLPAPGALQPVLVGGAGAKEDGEGQLGISEQQPQHAGLGTNEGGERVQIDQPLGFEYLIKAQTKP